MNQSIKIGIIGIGGVGGYYGGQLARHFSDSDKHHISFVARGKHLEMIQQHGLTVKMDETSYNCQPDLATADISKITEPNILIVCVKNYDLPAIAESLNTIIQPHTIILPLLNGVSSSEYLRNKLSTGIVLDACVYVNSFISAPDEVTQYGQFDKILFGHKAGLYKQEISFLEQCLTSAGIKAKSDQEIILTIWTKYLLISTFATLSSAKQATISELLADKPARLQLLEMLHEVKALAQAKGIPLTDESVEITFSRFQKFKPDTKSSMQLDFEKQKKTEVESLTGYIVEESKQFGLDTPVSSRLYKELKAQELKILS